MNLLDARIGVGRGTDRGAKSEPKGRQGLIPGSRAAPGYCGLRSSRGYLESVIGDLSYPDGGKRGLCEE